MNYLTALGLVGVADGLPSVIFTRNMPVVRRTRLEAVAAQERELDFSHVQPTSVVGSFVELQPVGNAFSFGGRERPV